MDNLRAVLLGLSEGGKRNVTTAMICDVLGANENSAQVMVCRRMSELVGRGEATRVSKGVYRYIPGQGDDGRAKLFRKIYRAVRAAKPGWTLMDIVLVSGTWEKVCRGYVQHLMELGLVARHGKKGNTLQFRTTPKGQERRDAPTLPHEPHDPYSREKNAALAIIQALLTRDLDRPLVRAKITENCRTILARFEKEESHADQ